jgi:hypothetical protein
MGVRKYTKRGTTFWQVDDNLKLPDGRFVRFRQRLIPTREQAVALLAKRRTEAFEGRFFERQKEATLTVTEAWALYEPISRRDNDTWSTDTGRWKHLQRHLGAKTAARRQPAGAREAAAKAERARDGARRGGVRAAVERGPSGVATDPRRRVRDGDASR